MKKGRILEGTRIGVFGKGGAGKSTLTVILAQQLAKQGYQVVVLDADSTNFGLPRALGLEPPERSLMEWFGGMVFSGGRVTCPVDDPTLLDGAKISLCELPQQFYSQNSPALTLFTAGKIGGLGPGAGCDGPVAKIARDFAVDLNGQGPVTLIDFKAGLEDSARGVLTRLDYVLVVVDPTLASIELAGEMRAIVEGIRADVLPATSHLEDPELVVLANRLFTEAPLQAMFCVLNRIPDEGSERYLRDKLRLKGLRPVAVISEMPQIQTGWLEGKLIDVDRAGEEALKIIHALEQQMADGE